MSQLATKTDEPVGLAEATELAKEKGTEVKEQASDRLRQQAQERSQQIGEGAQSLSQTLRRTASELRAQGQGGQSQIFDQAAIRAEQLGGYLTQSDPEQMLEDVRSYAGRTASFLRQQPLLLAAAGVATGLAGTKMASRIRSRQQA
jgi:hypothetical protein